MEKDKLTYSPHSLEVFDLVETYLSDTEKGLTDSEAEIRLLHSGKNVLKEKEKESNWIIFLLQFKNPMVALLFFASGLSFYFKEWLDGFAILIVVFINALIGFYMELKATYSMEALKKMSIVSSKVIRGGVLRGMNAAGIVPGDIVFIEAGDMVPADGRIISSQDIEVDESTLTGESFPVKKHFGVLAPDVPLDERKNMIYKSTFVTGGNAFALITSTGMNTEIGKIAALVHAASPVATPLEKKLTHFSKVLIGITVILVVIIFIVGILNGISFVEMLETSIALSVATIPEGLPIVATVVLARGMLKMARKNVVVKRLSAVETLGGTNVICTDKTGTLTQNKIEVDSVLTPEENEKSFEIMNQIAVLCNTAELKDDEEIGDPLEIGLLKYVRKNEQDILPLRNQFHKVTEQPFSSETKMMTVLYEKENCFSVYAKGAAEEILKVCKYILENGVRIELTEEKRTTWLKQVEKLSASGLKVIAGAYNQNASKEAGLNDDLIFAGLYCLSDPPREDVFSAIEECKTAGIKIIMITGDHPSTARNIAQRLSIIDKDNDNIINGKDMPDFDVLGEADKLNWMKTKVFARVTPKQKLDLVSVLQEKEYVVGMTGDGINDAPALKKADIGIAMGKRGTQVSQEAADMILMDDSFKSIVVAIKEGRVIFDNIRKFVIYLLSCNLSELLVISSAAIIGTHFQLLPIQILFINLITDVLPALALGMNKGDINIMNQPPKKIDEPIIDKKRWQSIFFYAVVISSMSLGAVYFSHLTVHRFEVFNPRLCNNILFFTLIVSQLFHVFNMNSSSETFFNSQVIKNKYAWGAIFISFALILLFYNIGPIERILSLYHMSVYDWLIVFSAGMLSMVLIQVGKKIKIKN